MGTAFALAQWVGQSWASAGPVVGQLRAQAPAATVRAMWIGIDPDARGAVATWDRDGFVGVAALPVDPSERAKVLRACVAPGARVALESIPLVTSNGHVGRQTAAIRWGGLREALRVLGCDVREVEPTTWMAGLRVLWRGIDRPERKRRLHAVAERVAGASVPLAHADAVLIGYWLRGLDPDVRGDGCVAAGG